MLGHFCKASLLPLFFVSLFASRFLWADTKYACPMRCEKAKTYAAKGSCPICKMDLEEVRGGASQPLNSIDFRVDQKTLPAEVPYGAPFQVIFSVKRTKTGEVVKEFENDKEAIPHAVMVSQSLEWLTRMRLTSDGNGGWKGEATPPYGGNFLFYVTFTPKGGVPQTFPLGVKVRGTFPKIADLVPGGAKPVQKGPFNYSVSVSPASLKAGEPGRVGISITRAGQPVTRWDGVDSEGARFTAISADTTQFPLGHVESNTKERKGQFEFHVTFPKPGLYKLWAEFLPEGKPFVVEHVVLVK